MHRALCSPRFVWARETYYILSGTWLKFVFLLRCSTALIIIIHATQMPNPLLPQPLFIQPTKHTSSHNDTNCSRAHFSSEWLYTALCLKSHLWSHLKSIYHLAHSKTTRGLGEAPLPFINNVYGVRGMLATVSLCVCLSWELDHWEWSNSWHLTPKLSNFTGWKWRKHCQHELIFYFGGIIFTPLAWQQLTLHLQWTMNCLVHA